MKTPSPTVRKLLRPLQLTAVVFFTVSGGPYGLEPLLGSVSSTTAIALLLLTPFLWSLPTILMVLELNGMMPKNGGYYQWVKTALGLKWGFLEGWWSWMWAFVDSAIYPVLFIEYFSFLFPAIQPFKYILCLAFIWGGAFVNLLGIVPVGKSSVVLGTIVLMPFLVLFAIALLFFRSIISTVPIAQPQAAGFAAFGMGLYTVMWNLLGWDNVSPFVEEVDRPVRSYFISIAVAFVLIVAVYLLSVMGAAHTGMDVQVLEARGFPSMGEYVGGWTLGAALSIGGMASALGLFLSVLLYISRVPKAMADDGLLPGVIARTHPKFKTPYVSILVTALVVSIMVLWGLADLLIIDVTLYSFGLVLEFLALIVLRKSNPDDARPFRIPLNSAGLIAMTFLPGICMMTALVGLLATGSVHSNAAWFAVGAVITGPVAWWVVKRWRKRTT